MLLERFKEDYMGKRFPDVTENKQYNFKEMVKFLEDETRQRRMLEAYPHCELLLPKGRSFLLR